MKHIVISVTNDLVTDRRVEKVCLLLEKLNYEITLIGRKLPGSLPISRKYKTIRMNLFFKKGFLFYAEYNVRLFLKILFIKKDILLANDLDTLSANYLVSKIQNKKLVYDSHELFTEVPELVSRPTVQKVWLAIENHIFPKLKNVYTVNNEIAEFYSKKYKIPVKVIRNITPKLTNKTIDKVLSEDIKGKNKMLILQGSGINMDRGAEEAVMMMQYLENTVLFIIGGGDVFKKLKDLVQKLDLKNKVFIKDKMPYNDLMEIIAHLVTKNNIGYVTKTHDPKELAEIIKHILSDDKKINIWKNNLVKASEIYTWENESKKLQEIFINLR